MRRQADYRPGVHSLAIGSKTRCARTLRANPTRAEAILWRELRTRRLGGRRFRRQHPIAGFIVDFFCPTLRLAIEVDGPIHDEQREDDHQRDEALQRVGVATLRVSNDDVLERLDIVLATILDAITRLSGPSR